MASIKRIGKDKLGVPIWEAVYRRTPGGKQIRRRFHEHDRREVERAVLLDSQGSGASIRWSEALRLYKDAKLAEGRGLRGIENVERAVAVWIEIMGDGSVEKTTPEMFKEFMRAVVERPVTHYATGKVLRSSGPGVANHHRKELLAVARHTRNHSGKISVIPFENVPTLPTRRATRLPIPRESISAYMEALPSHVWRPVMMVLCYGLRSSAVCNLTPEAERGGRLIAIDKGDVERHIPIDEMLRKILDDATAHRTTFAGEDFTANRLFVNAKGRGWTRMTLLRAAQNAWAAAGLERKKIHEVRHTLGTLAGTMFSPGMVQAAMGHLSRKSAETYFHPNEEMAAEVRAKIITEISQKSGKDDHTEAQKVKVVYVGDGEYTCPCCGHNFFISKE